MNAQFGYTSTGKLLEVSKKICDKLAGLHTCGPSPPEFSCNGFDVFHHQRLSAIQPVEGFGLSVATLAGVIGLAKTLSRELAADNIRINTICPGATDTPRLAKVNEQTSGMMDKLISEIPLGRIAKPEHVAALVALLVSPLGSHMTGTTIPVDGGQIQALL